MKHIIWSNYDLNPDDWKESYREFVEINELPDDTENIDNIIEYMYETNNMYLDDERANLNKELPGRILVIFDLGLWNGRYKGCCLLPKNISSIFDFGHFDYTEWYSDGKNIRSTSAHHDGTNYYEFRVVREDKNIQNLMNDIYNGKEVSRKKLNYYTRSLHPYIANVYGW